jgi:hypothetical protein
MEKDCGRRLMFLPTSRDLFPAEKVVFLKMNEFSRNIDKGGWHNPL